MCWVCCENKQHMNVCQCWNFIFGLMIEMQINVRDGDVVYNDIMHSIVFHMLWLMIEK